MTMRHDGPFLRHARRRLAIGAAGVASLFACRAIEDAPSATVEQAWQSARPVAPDPATFIPTGDGDDLIATVDGVPIDRARVVDLLVESRGVAVLDQLIVLVSVKQVAARQGIRLAQADIDAEYDRSLKALLGEIKEESPVLRQKAAESLLEQTLQAKNVSRGEYMIVMERNALLRRLVQPEISPTEAQLRREFDRLYGERVRIRHIQTSSLADIERVMQERARGVEFGALAVRYSANRASAERLGLLPPFTADDPDVPEPIRKEAFLLPVWHDSNPIQVDGWYHLIRVEKRIEAASISFEDVREKVEQSLRDRLTDAAMQRRYNQIFDEASVDIADAKLKELFYDAHPEHGASTR